MTIRQYYKAAALQGFLADRERVDVPADVARHCGYYADAMIAEDLEAAKD